MHIPKIRNNEAFVEDTKDQPLITNETLQKWDEEAHSVSKHLQLMYSIAKGAQAKRILEVGFGRSSKVFARVASENDGIFYSCDRQDYSNLFSEKEKETLHYVNGISDDLWNHLDQKNERIDFAFLDHFSGKGITTRFCFTEFRKCASYLNLDGYICVHDVGDERYPVRRLPKLVKMLGCFEVIQFAYNQGLMVVRKTSAKPSFLGLLVISFFHLKSSLRNIVYSLKGSS